MLENQPNEDVWFWLWELIESSKRVKERLRNKTSQIQFRKKKGLSTFEWIEKNANDILIPEPI
jgi:hypothetical protein